MRGAESLPTTPNAVFCTSGSALTEVAALAVRHLDRRHRAGDVRDLLARDVLAGRIIENARDQLLPVRRRIKDLEVRAAADEVAFETVRRPEIGDTLSGDLRDFRRGQLHWRPRHRGRPVREHLEDHELIAGLRRDAV